MIKFLKSNFEGYNANYIVIIRFKLCCLICKQFDGRFHEVVFVISFYEKIFHSIEPEV